MSWATRTAGGGPHVAHGGTRCSATGRVPRWLRAAHTVLPGGVPTLLDGGPARCCPGGPRAA